MEHYHIRVWSWPRFCRWLRSPKRTQAASRDYIEANKMMKKGHRGWDFIVPRGNAVCFSLNFRRPVIQPPVLSPRYFFPLRKKFVINFNFCTLYHTQCGIFHLSGFITLIRALYLRLISDKTLSTLQIFFHVKTNLTKLKLCNTIHLFCHW